jgi:hypothetical protein
MIVDEGALKYVDVIGIVGYDLRLLLFRYTLPAEFRV